ncbi:GCYA2-like protein [Mya arenaria]|uniref:guanylate cyclase n=1 Tax=Mya arenaria TaxID=6604 RepID=A0ABY7DQ76_MYAAR|nr:GCYA2-like protein [Mya arenaria]
MILAKEKSPILVGIYFNDMSTATFDHLSTGFMYKALYNILMYADPSNFQQFLLRCTSATEFEDRIDHPDRKYQPLDEVIMLDLIHHAATILDESQYVFQRRLGDEYFRLCLEEYGSCIRMMGSNMTEFLSNLDGLQTYISSSERFQSQVPPSSRCETQQNKLILHFYTARRNIIEYYAGIVLGISRHLFTKQATISVSCSNTPGSLHHTFTVYAAVDDCANTSCKICSPEVQINSKPSESKIGTVTFSKTFPFHFVVNKNLDIIQIGEAMAKHVKLSNDSESRELTKHFEVTRPKIEPFTYSALLSHTMDFKGQMIHLPEIDGILFLGTPSVEKLDELIEKGLYISDLPIHDATRDVILVGEQTKAQDGLRRRMEEIKQNIIEATKAVEEEKRKNVELLQMVFPSKVAQKLWRNEKVEPQCIDDVTMLFSDIVGFTSICSSCTPLDVINMLNSLYTNFDNCCGELEVYKVETIGDAYCVAGGLHRPSRYHANQIAWMALKMMGFASMQKSHDGKVIQMRIGIHTGTILAGVVGVTMPRYCLFGNHVTVANKLESGSEPTKININGFRTTLRSRDHLPQGFPADIDGTCRFLDSYTFPLANKDLEMSQFEHIDAAVEHYKINESGPSSNTLMQPWNITK